MNWRNVLVLGVATAIGLSGAPMVVLLGGLLGAAMAPAPVWATLPTMAMFAGMALATIPAALLMKRVGRKRGFLLGTLAALIGSAGAFLAIAGQSFILLCLSIVFIGVDVAFILQYRFAAAESVTHRYVGRAVSLVLAGGVVAGLLGPQLGRQARDWLPYGAYTGSFVALAVLYGVTVVLLLFFRETVVQEEVITGPERPLHAIVSQPIYLLALWCSMVAFGIMVFIMTAAPISMNVIDAFSLEDTTTVIQGHIVSMYLPSLFTGFLVDRLGARRLQALGAFSMSGGVIVALLGRSMGHYMGALIPVGIGWNLLFVGSTVLLTRSYYPAERFKSQALNDFITCTFQSLTTLLAGSVVVLAGWRWLNWISLPFLVLTLILILVARPREVSTAPASDSAHK